MAYVAHKMAESGEFGGNQPMKIVRRRGNDPFKGFGKPIFAHVSVFVCFHGLNNQKTA